MKKYKLLIAFNVLLTIGAASTWGYVAYEENKTKTEQTDPTLDVNESFGLKFEEESLSTTLDSLTEDNSEEIDAAIAAELSESLSTDIILDGTTEGVKEVTLVVSYDPEVILVEDIVDGDIFDSYESKEIDATLGQVKLKGAMTDEKSLTEGVFATINFKRLKEGDTNLIIFEDDETSTDFTKVTDFEGNSTTVKSAQISLF